MFVGTIKRYYQNVSLLGAYTSLDFMKQALLFPVDYYFRRGKSSFPININLALTLRCNAKCSMCALGGILNADSKELSLGQYRDFVNSCAKFRPGFVLYGGEPFLRNDIIDIVKAIKDKDLSCGIFTNGQLLNEGLMRELISLKLNFLVFSLYGPAEIHDSIVGIKGAHKRIIDNAAFLKKNRKNTKVIIHCTVSGQNIRHLNEVLDIGICDAVRFGHLTFMTDKNKEISLRELKISFPQEDIELNSFNFNPDKSVTGDFIANLSRLKDRGVSFTPELSKEEIRNWYSAEFRTGRKCLFAWRGVFVAPNGDIYPCMGNFYYKMGNILDDGLEHVWNSQKYIHFRRILKKRLLPACARCCRL